MKQTIGLGLAIFVQHGREQEAADFYSEAFEARQLKTYSVDGEPAGVEMLIGGTRVSVAGSNPRREEEPSHGGPFFPKAAGAVSMTILLTVPDIEACFAQAIVAGAALRDRVQTDTEGRRVASLFDPFGHIWMLTERQTDVERASPDQLVAQADRPVRRRSAFSFAADWPYSITIRGAARAGPARPAFTCRARAT